MPTFQIPTPPATPQKKQKPIPKFSDRHLSLVAPVRLENQLTVTKLNVTPRSTCINSNNSNSPGIPDIESLSQLINKRSQRGRKIGVCKQTPFAKSVVDDETSDKENEFFRKLPLHIPRIVVLGPAAIFQNGQSLKFYQAVDLAILLRRERGEKVCDTDTINNVGYILAYEMGLVLKQHDILLLKVFLRYGKTVETIALIVINSAAKDHKGSRATLYVA